MRILYHHRTSASDGSAVHIHSLLDALRDLGAEVLLVEPAVGAPRRNGGTSLLARMRRRAPRAAHELAELALNAIECLRLHTLVKRFGPDLIYERSNLFLLSGTLVARAAGVPIVTEVNAPFYRERSAHGGLSLGCMARWTELFAWRNADAIVAVTDVLAGMIAAEKVDRIRIHVMPNGIDPDAFCTDRIDDGAKRRLGLEDRVVLGFTGYVRQWNGLEQVVDVLALPGNGHLHLVVVGDGPGLPAVQERARALGVATRLTCAGHVERDDVAGWVSAFDVALLPAVNPYASPLKLFEYMALRRCIVAPDQPNIREVLTNEKDALMFRPGDDASLAACLSRLGTEPQLRSRLADAAVQTLGARDLTWRSNAERVLELARGLSRSGTRQPAGHSSQQGSRLPS